MKYYTPDFEIELFEVADVITASEPAVPTNNKPDRDLNVAGDIEVDFATFGF